MPRLDTTPARVLGLDIAKATVTVFDSRTASTRTLPNSRRVLRALLAAHGPDSLIVCEPTGGHEAVLLEEALRAGIPCHRADTLKLKAFIRSFGRLAKTDAIDAASLAAYGRERWATLALWTQPDIDQARLQALVRRRRDLLAIRIAEQNRAKAPGARALKASFRAMLAACQREIDSIDWLIDALIAQSRILNRRMAVCTAMAGIGRSTAANLLGLMPELGRLERRTAASLAGLAPHPNDSGAFSGRRRMRGGRPEIAPVLFMPALVAASGKGEFAAFYKRLTTNGKKPIQAIAAVMRKIVVTLNARLRDAELKQS